MTNADRLQLQLALAHFSPRDLARARREDAHALHAAGCVAEAIRALDEARWFEGLLPG